MTPELSIIIPVYNAEAYFREALSSVISQTFKDFEIIIIDDTSSDGSLLVAEEMRARDSRIRIFELEKLGPQHKRNRLVEALNLGIAEARGKYIVRFDADDIMDPDRLFIQHSFMESQPKVDILGSWFQCFGNSQKLVQHPTSHYEIVRQLVIWCVLGHPTLMIRRRVFEDLKLLYSDKYAHAEDYELWCRCFLSKKVTFSNIPKPLLRYRVHAKQIGSIHTEEQLQVSRLMSIRNIKTLGFNNDSDIFFLRFYLQTENLQSLKTIFFVSKLFWNLDFPLSMYGKEFFTRGLVKKTVLHFIKLNLVHLIANYPVFRKIFGRKLVTRLKSFSDYSKHIRINRNAI